jgi:predicted GIY-YIG superfamily endonuclease
MTDENLALPLELLGSVERYAVYRCYSDQGELLYIGETGDLGKRLASHAGKLWFVQVRGITLEWYADELDALKAERRAIHVEHPKYNKVHRSLTNAQAAQAKTVASKRQPKPKSASTPSARRAVAEELLSSDPALSTRDLMRLSGVSKATADRIRSAATSPARLRVAR